jgi:hypothetical protein
MFLMVFYGLWFTSKHLLPQLSDDFVVDYSTEAINFILMNLLNGNYFITLIGGREEAAGFNTVQLQRFVGNSKSPLP